MFFWILAAVGVTVLIYQFVIKPMKYWKNRGVKHGKIVPIFGNNLKNALKLQSFGDMVLDVYNECPGTRYSGFFQMTIPTLVLKDPDLIKQITVKDFDHFLDHRTFIPEEADPLWAKNLFALTGQKWREMRATLSPTFTSAKMRAMFVLMSEAAENFVKYFEKANKDVIEIEMKDTFTRFANDVIASTAFGIKCDSLEDRNNEFYVQGKEITDFSGFWKSLKFFGYLFIPKVYKALKVTLFSKEASAFFRGIVAETIKTREEKKIVRPDMMQLLIEARKGTLKHEESNGIVDAGFATVEESDVGKAKVQVKREITDDDITAQALIFFFAGFDSVSGLMCFLIYELGVNQDIQEKLRDEIMDTLKECNGKLTYEALLNMKYLDMVLSETLRKWPNAVAVDRVCTKPYTIQPVTPDETPVKLEKGDVLWLPIFGIHRDPEIYPEPEKFIPERFSDENKGNIRPYTYIPFGVGPRNCIGSRFAILEAKAVTFHVLSKFSIIPVEKTQIPVKLSKKSFNLNAEKGFWFGLKKLETAK